MTFMGQVSTVILVTIIGMSSSQQGAERVEFTKFMRNFNKPYATDKIEGSYRFKLFKENLEVIRKHNILYGIGESSYKMGVNEYSDKTWTEMLAEHTGIINPYDPRNSGAPNKRKRSSEWYDPPQSIQRLNSIDYRPRAKRSDDWYNPTQSSQKLHSIDYRTRGAVNPVLNQGKCGSCWATSITASIEGVISKTHPLPQLSYQNLIDCAPFIPGRLEGCVGGWPEYAIEYVINKGISYSDNYPYLDRKDRCINTRKSKYVKDFKKVYPGNDNDLMDALVTHGPISITIFASPNFHQPSEGVFKDNLCASGAYPYNGYANHAVTLVGYDTDTDGKKYWLIKNSWGTSWGEGGYLKVSRDSPNHCLISEHGVIPVLNPTIKDLCEDTSQNCEHNTFQCKNSTYTRENCKKTCNQCNNSQYTHKETDCESKCKDGSFNDVCCRDADYIWTPTLHACIRGNNGPVHYNLRSMRDCQRACQSSTPTCRSVEYHPNSDQCALSYVSTSRHLASFEAPCRDNGWVYAEWRRVGSFTPPLPAAPAPGPPTISHPPPSPDYDYYYDDYYYDDY